VLKSKKKNAKTSFDSSKAKIGFNLLLVSTFLTPTALANVVGSDTQNFNPITSGLDFVTVHSSETLKPGYFNFGLFLNHAVNTLPYFDDTEQGRSKYTDSLLGADINIGIGILPNWDFGLSIPQILDQQVKSEGYRGQFNENGNTEIRMNTKVRLYGNDSGGIAVIGSANQNRIKNNPFTGIDAGPTYNLELAMDTTIAKTALALNVGYRWRDKGEIIKEASPILPMGDQIIASLAASYLFTSIDTKLIGEVFGSAPSEEEMENSKRLTSSSELLIGLKHDNTRNIATHFGAGTELINGRASPDWRIYAGINISTGPKARTSTVQSIGNGKELSDPFAGPAQSREKIVIHDILFEFDSHRVSLSQVSPTMKKLVAHLKKNKGYKKLIIEGHTDSIGPRQYNSNLSKRRAETIRQILITKYGLKANKIEARGSGEDLPIADNGNFQGRQLNRRVEFAIFRDM